MQDLLKHAERVAALLKQRNETIAVSESSTGGLVTAALLAVPGASAYCLGGVVLYTRQAWHALRDFDESLLKRARSATEENAWLRADLAGRKAQDPIVVLTHRPLFPMYPQWDWATRDGAKAVNLLLLVSAIGGARGHGDLQ